MTTVCLPTAGGCSRLAVTQKKKIYISLTSYEQLDLEKCFFVFILIWSFELP